MTPPITKKADDYAVKLRDAFARRVRAFACERVIQSGRNRVTVVDIDKAWDALIFERPSGVDVFAANLIAEASLPEKSLGVEGFFNEAINHVCTMKTKTLSRVIERAVQEATLRNSQLIEEEDIGRAWDKIISENTGDLEAQKLLVA